MWRFLSRPRREVALDFSRKLQSIVLAISSNEPKQAFEIWQHLETESSKVHSDDFTILRNHFLTNVKVNCEDRLKLAYDFDHWRLAHHVSARDHIFGYRYFQADLTVVPSLSELKIPPLPFAQESLTSNDEEGNQQPQELWNEAFDHMNAAFFRSQLPRPAGFAWKELGVLSKSSWAFTENGIKFNVQLNHRLHSSPLCFGMLLHELIHIWDETTWKPVEPSWTPMGHGVHWTAKAEQVQMALKYTNSSLMVNLTDEIPARPQQSPPQNLPSSASRRQPAKAPLQDSPPVSTSKGFMASLKVGGKPRLQPRSMSGAAPDSERRTVLRMTTEPGQAVKAGRYVVDVLEQGAPRTS